MLELESLKELINEKFNNLNDKLDSFILGNNTEHGELYKKANMVPVLEEQNKSQQAQIDRLTKWLVASFSTALLSIIGVTTALVIFLVTKG